MLLPQVRLFGDTYHRPTLLPKEMSQVRDSDGSERITNLRRFFKMLEWHLTVGLLGFLYEGYEAWASIIRDIKKKLKGKR